MNLILKKDGFPHKEVGVDEKRSFTEFCLRLGMVMTMEGSGLTGSKFSYEFQAYGLRFRITNPT